MQLKIRNTFFNFTLREDEVLSGGIYLDKNATKNQKYILQVHFESSIK